MIKQIEERLEACRENVKYILDNEVEISPTWMENYVYDILFFCRLHVDKYKTQGARFFVFSMVGAVYDLDLDYNGKPSDAVKAYFDEQTWNTIRQNPVPNRQICVYIASVMVTMPQIVHECYLGRRPGFADEIFDQHEKLLKSVREYTELKKSIK
jgi:hypothetical protein